MSDQSYKAYDPSTGTGREPSAGAGQDGQGALGYAAVGLAWLIPGAGHLIIGQRGRGLVFMITIHALFAMGLFIGGIHAMNPSEQPIWSYTQFLAGWPTLAANTLAQHVASADAQAKYDLEHNGDILPPAQRDAKLQAITGIYAPKIQDVGTVYCGLAGMLNLLLVFDVLVRITATPEKEAAT